MIKDTLKSAIKNLSSSYGLSHLNIRIKIDKKDGKLGYEIMDKQKVIDKTNVATALNLSSPVAFLVGNKLSSIIDSISKENNVPLNSVNVRIYNKTDDCEPLLYLFDGINPLKSLDINNYV